MKTACLVPVLIAVCGAYTGNLGPGALSGVPGLPLSDMLEDGYLRVRTGFEHTRLKEAANLNAVPIGVCRGFGGDYEVGFSIPVYLSDDSRSEPGTGDLTLSGAMLYETTRGGTALKFTGAVYLPTGAAGRDPGAGVSAGAVTSTTFRLFRFSASGTYRLLGGQEPGKARWRDSVAFAFGGMSFLGDRTTVFSSIHGDSEGALRLQAGASLEPWRQLVLDCSLMTDMADHGSWGVFLGTTWTFEGR